LLREQLAREREDKAEIASRIAAQKEVERVEAARLSKERAAHNRTAMHAAAREQAMRDRAVQEAVDDDRFRREESQRQANLDAYLAKMSTGQSEAKPKPDVRTFAATQESNLTLQEASELLGKLKRSEDELQQTRNTLNEHIRRDLERVRERVTVPSIPSTDGFTFQDPASAHGSAGVTPLPSSLGYSLGTGPGTNPGITTFSGPQVINLSRPGGQGDGATGSNPNAPAAKPPPSNQSTGKVLRPFVKKS
jgi:hypothetical protein